MRRVLDVGLQADTFTNNASALPCRVLSRRLPIVMPAAIKAHFHSQADCRRDPLGPGCFTLSLGVRAPGNVTSLGLRNSANAALRSPTLRAVASRCRSCAFWSGFSTRLPSPHPVTTFGAPCPHHSTLWEAIMLTFLAWRSLMSQVASGRFRCTRTLVPLRDVAHLAAAMLRCAYSPAGLRSLSLQACGEG